MARLRVYLCLAAFISTAIGAHARNPVSYEYDPQKAPFYLETGDTIKFAAAAKYEGRAMDCTQQTDTLKINDKETNVCQGLIKVLQLLDRKVEEDATALANEYKCTAEGYEGWKTTRKHLIGIDDHFKHDEEFVEVGLLSKKGKKMYYLLATVFIPGPLPQSKGTFKYAYCVAGAEMLSNRWTYVAVLAVVISWFVSA